MKRYISVLFFFFCTPMVFAQKPVPEVTVVTCVESVIPSGIGRSRMFETKLKVNYMDFTSQQTAAHNDKNDSKRKDIRLKEFEETKLLNLYNEGGIRFQNVASNDALTTSKINEMLTNGWDLFFVATGVESQMIGSGVKKELLKMGLNLLLNDNKNEDKNDPNGMFITRYYFIKYAK